MVCKKLRDGGCRINGKTCMKPYDVKMINYKSCPVWKRARAKK